MGLFSKSSGGNDIEFDGKMDEDNGVTTLMKDSSDNSNETYGIQDAIKLMRKLPNVNTDIVISVVIKTLESADIKVEEIISDAQQRESRIEDRSVKLITEIDELESQISKLNSEITQLNSDLEETSKVKSLLLQSIEANVPASSSQPTKEELNLADEELSLAEGST